MLLEVAAAGERDGEVAMAEGGAVSAGGGRWVVEGLTSAGVGGVEGWVMVLLC